ncbi:MAG: DUF4031 domain-containing protein [Actinomycetota bacterium]|nr:DUF4031 domain-containing protein [Actinomycetota bacterium]
MTVLIDEPRWWFMERHWSHLVSDRDLDELHEFATAAGIPRRGFHGDHYDVPEEYYEQMVAQGAVPATSRDVVRALRAAGLRMTPSQRRAAE